MRAEFTKATKVCASCGAMIERTYNLSASRWQRPMYCNIDCEQTAKHQRAMKKREVHFWTKVKRGAENECWEWQGYTDPRGYGRYGRILAHRIAFELSRKISASEFHICHSCDNPPCVNPAHLWAGTHADNVADMIKKGRRRQGRVRRGEDNNKAKLTAADALNIFRSPKPAAVLARQYGITKSAIYLIKHGRNWAHVTRALS